jgi:hypothetical protein
MAARAVTEPERHHPPRIVVLGAERSGTSLVTEMIHRWGAHAGEPDKLTGPDEHNPQGRWEYEPLWDLLADLGDFADGATWWDAFFEERVASKLRRPSCVAKAHALLGTMDRIGLPWVWKDPALCHFLSFWKPMWGEVAYVITIRHPYDVARSWQRMAVPGHLQQSVDLVRSNLLRWQHMMLQVLRATEGVPNKVFVEYEAVMRNPEDQALRLATFLSAHCAVEAAAEERVRAMANAANPSFWRLRCDLSLSEIAEATDAQVRLYEFLRCKVDDDEAPFVDDFPMPDGTCQARETTLGSNY